MTAPDSQDESGMEALLDGLKQMADESTPDDAYWCPNCTDYTVTNVLGGVRRPAPGKKNKIWGCTECEYSMVPQTEWEDIEDGK